MPILDPSQVPEPKSACTPVSRPIDAMIAFELAATGSVSTGWFHGLLAGNTGQPPSVGDADEAAPAVDTATSVKRAAAATFTTAAVAAAPDARLLRTSDMAVPSMPGGHSRPRRFEPCPGDSPLDVSVRAMARGLSPPRPAGPCS